MSATLLGGLVVAGAAGAVSRTLVDGLVQRRSGGRLPWGTFAVNVSGSLLLGLVAGAALAQGLPDTAAVWVGTGFCGAFTTFSTHTFETVRLLEEGQPTGALVVSVGTLLAGTAAAGLGLAAMGAL